VYCRYTQFSFEPADRSSVERFWEEVGGPIAARQPGFKGGLILDSEDSAGIVRAITVWADRADFDAFSGSDEHQPIVDGVRSTMKTEARDGLRVLRVVEPHAGEVRVIRARIHEGCVEHLRNYWTTAGRSLVESAPGCIKADAFVDTDALEAVIMFVWRTAADADAFRSSAVHNEEFVPAIERFVTPIARLHTERL
jgi:heme-degrading monooxygenase HmoA